MRRYNAGTPRFGKGQKMLMRLQFSRIQAWQNALGKFCAASVAGDAIMAGEQHTPSANLQPYATSGGAVREKMYVGHSCPTNEGGRPTP